MPYKNEEQRKIAGAERAKRHREKVTPEKVTPGVTPKSHPNMPPVVKAWLLSEYGFLPTEHLGPMTLEQYKAAHCMKCGGFYLIGTDRCPRCDVTPHAERLRALAGATKLVDVKG